MGRKSRARAAERAFRETAASSAPAIVAAEGGGGVGDFTSSTFTALVGTTGMGAVNMNEREAMTLPAVMRALELLSGVFAMTPMIYYRKLPGGGKERAEKSPLYSLFHDKPNTSQSIFTFKEVLLGDILLTGGSFNFVHRDQGYQAAGLSRLFPTVGVNQQWDEVDGHTFFYDAMLPNGARRRLTENECFHVPGFSRDGLIGVNRIHLLREALHGAVATSQFAARFWENNAQPTTVLTTKGKLDKPTKDQMKADWRALYGGRRNAGETAVLDQEVTPTFHSHDNKAAQYLETRAFHVVEVSRAFGVPPHLLFELSRATFSNIEQQSLEFIQFCMMLHYERVAAAATHYFAEPGHFYEFLPDALTKGDLKSRYEAYGIGIDKGFLNPNEVRRTENRNDREGGDDYRVGSGSTIEGEAPQTPPPAPKAPEPDEEEE